MINLFKIYYFKLFKKHTGFYSYDSRGRRRPICDVSMDVSSDYPKFVDSFCLEGFWEDTGEELTENELDELNNDGQLVYELVIEQVY